MKKFMLNKLTAFSLLLLLVGCAEKKYAQPIDKFCPPAATKADSASSPQADAMTAAQRVLADMHFAIEKLDAETGFIRTQPLTGAQSFEFWRADSVGSFNQSEADLQSIRRTVEINVTQQDQQLCIDCRATTQRLSTAQSQDKEAMAESYHSAQHLKFGRDQKATIAWIDLGRDNQLETEIIKRIEKRLATLEKGKAK
jgi:hypothetical protein